jgi:hypothetical protein
MQRIHNESPPFMDVVVESIQPLVDDGTIVEQWRNDYVIMYKTTHRVIHDGVEFERGDKLAVSRDENDCRFQ